MSLVLNLKSPRAFVGLSKLVPAGTLIDPVVSTINCFPVAGANTTLSVLDNVLLVSLDVSKNTPPVPLAYNSKLEFVAVVVTMLSYIKTSVLV